MICNFLKPALALGAVLAATGAASAGDRNTTQLSGGTTGSTTMTLGGKGTPAQAATEDTELARGYGGGYHGGGGFHGGYRGGYGGYRGGYYGGYRGYYGGYRGAYYGGYRGFYRPYYAGYYGYGYPYYGLGLGYGLGYGGYGYGYPYYGYGYGYPSVGVYLGIGGGTGTSAPVVNLANYIPPSAPLSQPTVPGGNGTFPYDGGPANPVPLPKADPNVIPPANPAPTVTDLPISLKPKAPSPYKYKAYCEK